MKRPVVYMLVAVLLSSLGAGVAALTMVRYQQAENDRRWCSLLVDISRGQRESPANTESGRRFAEEIDHLRREFGCPEP